MSAPGAREHSTENPNVKKKFIQYLILAAVLTGTPLLCVWLSGRTELMEGVLAFPPRTEDWGPDTAKLWNLRRPFAWGVFLAMAGGILASILPFACRLLFRRGAADTRTPRKKWRLPWFGWAGVLLGAASWVLAWNRFAWFAPLQVHTFLPLWLAYILVVNALTVRRSAHCLMTSYPRAYALLFPVSAAFWWFFEYLNRYVWNWYYVGIAEMGAPEYAFFATCSFATVLPAVTATAEWLGTFRPFSDQRLCGFRGFDIHRPLGVAALIAIAATGLCGIVCCPHLTYPLLWISPLAVFLVVGILTGEATVLDGVRSGDWRLIVRFALASLICGFFWEMWNFHSAAQWIYAVPYVHRFQIFEMPVLGFAGYLPFGVECAAVAAWILPQLTGSRQR